MNTRRGSNKEMNIPGVSFGGKGSEYAEFVMDVVKLLLTKIIEPNLILNIRL